MKKYPPKYSRRANGPVTKEYLLSKTIKDPTTGCWLWTGRRNHFGYGITSEGNKTIKAHRKVWELWRATIPDGLLVCHRCDNPACCNPDHLFLGTYLDNNRDIFAKNRMPVGVNHANSKLTAAQVVDIRFSKFSYSELAKLYKMSTCTLWKIKNRVSYKTVP